MTKVAQIDKTEKKFIPHQVGIHNRAIDYLGLMQMCINKINTLKTPIENIDADLMITPSLWFHLEQMRAEAVERHDDQVRVYRWLLSRYLNHMTKLYTETLYHDTNFYPTEMPDALKNVKAA